eukprot:SAG31_NODE_611_length_13558_cov_224.959730_3_plen_67_part_00
MQDAENPKLQQCNTAVVGSGYGRMANLDVTVAAHAITDLTAHAAATARIAPETVTHTLLGGGAGLV